MWFKLIYIASFCILYVVSSPGGAPLTACDTMMPIHGGFQDQLGDLPVNVIIESIIISGQLISIRIEGTDILQSFGGFLIQAISENEELIGTFHLSENVRVINCRNISGSSATHTGSAQKTAVDIIWEAPITTELIVFNFFITIAGTFQTFWAKRRTSLQFVIPPSLVPTENPIIPIDPTLPIEEDLTIYDGCGDTKVCFGVPDNCYLGRMCDILGAVSYDNHNFTFELLAQDSHEYVAMGLSNTKSMGDSSVVECVRSDPYKSFASWTLGNVEAQRTTAQDYIELVEGMSINGRVYCKVQRKAFSAVKGVEFDLINNKYYLLLASGPLGEGNNIAKHENHGISFSPVQLTVPQYVRQNEPQNVFILIHGSFMIVSWIGLTSIGIVFARYFKKSWTNKKACGQDVWFIWHVICMFLSWTLTIAGFIVIFVYRGEWSTSAHAIIGCIVLGLTVIQPIGAVFRPDANSRSRSLFNWLHQAFGNITHALAVITIFFAVRFPEARLPHYTLYILAAFVSFYLIMHIIFTAVDIRGDMKRNKNSRTKNSKTMPFQIIQKTLLGFFIISMMIFVIALLLVFTLGFED
ncbi:hypothetical protein ACKWTF_001253 [Chironomus riparius]